MGRNDIAATEILMIVAGIGIVSSIVFPTLGYRRDNVRRGSCQNNLKSLTLVIKQYMQDTNDRFPVASLGAQTTAMTGKGSYGWADALVRYSRPHAIFHCPSGRNFGAATVQPWQGGYTDYFLNRRLSGRSESQVPNSAFTVLLGDGSADDDIADARYSLPSLPPSWRSDPLSPARRHREGANYSFADGHVKWLRIQDAPGTAPSKSLSFTFLP